MYAWAENRLGKSRAAEPVPLVAAGSPEGAISWNTAAAREIQ
jgi:hypothetical protein